MRHALILTLALLGAPAPAQPAEDAESLKARILALEAQAQRDAKTIATLRARIERLVEDGLAEGDPSALSGRLRNLTLETQQLRSAANSAEARLDQSEQENARLQAETRAARREADRARDEARRAAADARRAESDARRAQAEARRLRSRCR